MMPQDPLIVTAGFIGLIPVTAVFYYRENRR